MGMTGGSGMGRIARLENGAVCGKLIADRGCIFLVKPSLGGYWGGVVNGVLS